MGNELETPKHHWNVTPKEAVAIQKELRNEVRIEPYPHEPRYIAGVDVSYDRFSTDFHAAIVILDAGDDLRIIERATAHIEVEFPYVPGLLSFREIPVILEAWEKLVHTPDVIVVDGQGIAHPRRFGIASHLGILLDMPTIGCGKSLLHGSFETLGDDPGATSPLMSGHEQIGVAWRTKKRSNPLIISPGHKMDVKSALRILKSTLRGYRIPEPTRQAHIAVNEFRRAAHPHSHESAASH